MAIPCPGTKSYDHIFGVGRNGPTAFVAFIRAFIVLLLEIARSRSLRDFLEEECRPPCDRLLTGPAFSNFTVRLAPRAAGGWSCVMGGRLEGRIDCVRPDVEASDEELLAALLAELRGGEQTRA